MRLIAGVLLVAGLTSGALPKERAAEPPLTAAQIIAKNVAARGGLEAWRNIQTMAWFGHLESADAAVPGISFVLDQERPNRTRFETNAMNQKSVRVFDGTHGWKVTAGRGGRPVPQPYTPQEAQFAHAAQVIDGPLIDYAAKGNSVALEGMDTVEGRKAYRLSVKLASGETQKMWIDAKTFLDIRYDRMSYTADAKPSIVSVYYRRYQAIDGLQIPSTLEVGVGSGKPPDRMVIDKIELNPPLDKRTFAKPASNAINAAAFGADPGLPGRLPSSRLRSTRSGMPAAQSLEAASETR